MEPNNLLKYLKSLISINEGVEVVGLVGNNSCLKIEFVVSNESSRLLLVSAAEASNIYLDLCTHYEAGSSEAISNPEYSLHYRYRSNEAFEAIDNFCWLGAHLTWKMYKLGIIDSNEEKKYCKYFGAESRSA